LISGELRQGVADSHFSANPCGCSKLIGRIEKLAVFGQNFIARTRAEVDNSGA
jgi:hypothetical protein